MQNFLTAPSRSDLGASTTSHMSSGSDVDVGGATRRAVLCDVVVERPGEETAALLAQLGGTLGPDALRRTGDREVAAAPAEERSAWEPSRRDEMALRLQQLTEELLRTERSYVSRIEALQKVR
jgi:hypothetical protein